MLNAEFRSEKEAYASAGDPTDASCVLVKIALPRDLSASLSTNAESASSFTGRSAGLFLTSEFSIQHSAFGFDFREPTDPSPALHRSRPATSAFCVLRSAFKLSLI